MIEKIINMAWRWFSSNIQLPFDKNTIKNQLLDIGANQGLPAVVESLENMVPLEMKSRLNHSMWQTMKQVAECDNSTDFVNQASTMLQNSGQADEIINFMNQK